jgi:hypothetical protein
MTTTNSQVISEGTPLSLSSPVGYPDGVGILGNKIRAVQWDCLRCVALRCVVLCCVKSLLSTSQLHVMFYYREQYFVLLCNY